MRRVGKGGGEGGKTPKWGEKGKPGVLPSSGRNIQGKSTWTGKWEGRATAPLVKKKRVFGIERAHAAGLEGGRRSKTKGGRKKERSQSQLQGEGEREQKPVATIY